MSKGFGFFAGAALGALAGTVIGILVAPRPGSETRAMAADIANDAWDSARDMYEQGVDTARAAANDFAPIVDAKTDELRAKVDLARDRMDQLREQLNDAINASGVTPAADVVVEAHVENTGDAQEENQASEAGAANTEA
ncbi:YtxH domain-containing protein [Collinsella sp. zg1085]|uniref:YtxH domain-containing protein n=1 Tax=Collinsella sp. zg1085 TaxID=2844380 RepID=UPI001C0B0A70|nr:YtxH domain-containing protein [Collinsella sp. zg1085]QWT17785.1 YtxH domain-containing protein [Collinsella sp. zg1085]